MKNQLWTKAFYFSNFFKQRLYKIQKRPTSLSYHVLLNLKYLDTLGILSLVFPCYDQFGFGGSNEPLYTSKDVGITLVNHSNFKNVILDSDTAWMVEFYSSWCGHCIRFAPVFKELGTNVEGKFNVYVVRLQVRD